MKARIKSNQKICTGIVADILVKAKKAIYLEDEEANKAKIQKMNDAKKAKAAEKQKQPNKQVEKPLKK